MSGGLISTAMSRRSKISIIRFRRQATNKSTTTNFPNVADDLLPYDMASATLTINTVFFKFQWRSANDSFTDRKTPIKVHHGLYSL